MTKQVILIFAASMLLLASPRGEFIFEQAPFASCHASTIVETAPGQFMAAWFGGSAEGNPDVAIWGARRSGAQWSEPVELARESKTPCWNPVLFTTRDKVLWLYYKFGSSPSSWTAGRRSSSDGGKTWSQAEHLPAGIIGPVKDKPLVLPSGLIVSGTSVESYRSWACWVERSTDNGRTWTKHGPIIPDRGTIQGAAGDTKLAQVPGSEFWDQTFGVIQPAIVRVGNKRLLMLMRATGNIGRICYSESNDEGRTWSQAKPSTLPNPNSGIDAVALRDGRIVLIYNHTPKGRTPLNLAVSRDGETWNNFLALETEPGEFSYPAIIQASDDAIHATYTWKRKTIKHVAVPLSEIPER